MRLRMGCVRNIPILWTLPTLHPSTNFYRSYVKLYCGVVVRSTLISSLKININSPAFDKSAPELFSKIGLIFKIICPASGRKYKCRVDLMTTIGSKMFELALDVRIFGNPSVFVKKTRKTDVFTQRSKLSFTGRSALTIYSRTKQSEFTLDLTVR